MSTFLSEMIPKLSLESMDGTVIIPLDNSMGWIRMPGATGLEEPPVEVVASPIPGVAGSMVQDVRVQQRPVFIPIYGRATTQREFRTMRDTLRTLVSPLGKRTFKLVGTTVRGTREMIVTYEEGLEGADDAVTEGLNWCKIGLKATAHEPYAQAREDRRLEFRLEVATDPFLGTSGGTDATWPGALANTAVIGTGMEVEVASEVPVYPTLELHGGMTSFLGELSPIVVHPDGTVESHDDESWMVDVPAGVPTGSELILVTDPRRRSIRFNGTLAASRIARGSTLRPFYPGKNTLNVTAPGGDAGTLIVLSWREKYGSLW